MTNHRQVAQRMMREGPGFHYDLGQAIINTDNGIPCVKKLAEALTYADSANQAKLLRLLRDGDRILGMNQADRITLITDEFAEVWTEYTTLAA